MRKGLLASILGLSIGLISTHVHAQPSGSHPQTTAERLAPFERLVGKRWFLGESTMQEFEWGVGRQSVRARGYVVAGGEAAELISEGTWFWHPGAQAIKGAFTAVDMPISFFDYTTRFEGDSIVSELTAYPPSGGHRSISRPGNASETVVGAGR